MKREKWKESSEESGVLRKEHQTRNKREEKPKVPTHAFAFFSTPYFLLLTSLIVSLAWKTPLANLFSPPKKVRG